MRACLAIVAFALGAGIVCAQSMEMKCTDLLKSSIPEVEIAEAKPNPASATWLPATGYLSFLEARIRDKQMTTMRAPPLLRHKSFPLIADLVWTMDECCRSIGDGGEE